MKTLDARFYTGHNSYSASSAVAFRQFELEPAELESLAAIDGIVPTLHRIRRLPPAALTDGQWERIEALVAVLPPLVAGTELSLKGSCSELSPIAQSNADVGLRLPGKQAFPYS